MPSPKKVLIIGTSGAIIALPEKDGTLRAAPITRERILASIPDLEHIAPIDVLDLMCKDSVNLTPQDWLTIAEAVKDNIAQYLGIVILHGSDTIAYTASALSLMVRDLPCPVVLTSSLNPIEYVSSDGRANLAQAVRVAANADLGEVCVVSDNQILRGNRIKKTERERSNTLDSIQTLPLGKLIEEISLSPEARPRQAINRLKTNICIDDNVCLLIHSPSFDHRIFSDDPNWNPHGVVSLGYGSGCLSTTGRASVLPLISYCQKKQIPIVVSTQAAYGTSWTGVHSVGKEVFDSGAISAHDMTYEAALVKLMWVLGQTKEVKRVRQMMLSNYAGEISPPIMEDAEDFFEL